MGGMVSNLDWAKTAIVGSFDRGETVGSSSGTAPKFDKNETHFQHE